MEKPNGGDEEETAVTNISSDYFFMSTRDEQAKENPVLVMLDEDTGDKYARAAGRKGVGEEGANHWLVKYSQNELKAWGHTCGDDSKLILKSDGGSSITAFRECLGKFHGGIILPEKHARGASQSNGKVERSCRTIREFTRVPKEQLEEKPAWRSRLTILLLNG